MKQLLIEFDSGNYLWSWEVPTLGPHSLLEIFQAHGGNKNFVLEDSEYFVEPSV